MKLLIVLLLSFFTYLLGANLNKIDTFEANFLQTIKNSSNKIIKYKGTIYIKKPSSILWQYDDPIKKYVYIKDKEVTIIEPELEQAIKTLLDTQLDIFTLINKAKKISTDIYQASFNGTVYNITIENNLLKRIDYKDELENDISILFFNQKQNQKIKNTTFSYNIPEEFDIIRK